MAFRVASKGNIQVISKVSTSQNTKVKKVTLGRPVSSVGPGGAQINGSLSDLIDVTVLPPIEDGSVLVYNAITEKWENTRTLDNQIIDGNENGQIKISNSGTVGDPTLLATGEMHYSFSTGEDGDKLYIGTGAEIVGNSVNHQAIGGKYYTDLLGGESAPFGIVSPNKALIADSNGELDIIKVGDVTLTNGTLLNTSGDLLISSAENINVQSNRITNLAEPVDAQDAVTKVYADAIAAQAQFTVAAGTGTKTFTPASIPLTLSGGTGLSAQLDSSTNTVTFDLDTTGVTSGTYGSQTLIPNITVDAEGRITNVVTSEIASVLTVNNKPISLLDSGLDFVGSSNINTSFDSATNSVGYSLNSDVTGLTSLAVDQISIDGNTITSSDSSGELTLSADTVVIPGNLIVRGNQTVINSTELTVHDRTLTLGSGAANAGEADGAGIIIDGANASLTYDYANNRLTANTGLNVDGPLTINGTSIAETIDDRVSNLIVAGDGLDVLYDDTANAFTISAELATTTNTGTASFDSDQFVVDSAGQATITKINGNDVLVKAKTYTVQGELPSEQDLELGEVAINVTDGKMFIKKLLVGIESIIEIGSGIGGGGTFDTFEFVATAQQTVITGSDSFGSTLSFIPDGKTMVFLNGILLTNVIDYDATVGSEITFVEPLLAGYTVQVAAYVSDVVSVANDLGLNDSTRLMLGAGYDTIIQHNGTDTTFDQYGNGNIIFQHDGNNVAEIADDSVILHEKLVVEEYTVDTSKVITSGAMDPVTVDTVPLADFRSARYTVQISNISSNEYQSLEVLLVHDGSQVLTTTFGELFTGTSTEGTVDFNIVGSNLVLTITPSSTNSYEFKSVRHSISV